MELFAELAQVKTRNKQLSATIAEQAKEIKHWKSKYEGYGELIDDYAETIEAQKAKISTLRVALEDIKTFCAAREGGDLGLNDLRHIYLIAERETNE